MTLARVVHKSYTEIWKISTIGIFSPHPKKLNISSMGLKDAPNATKKHNGNWFHQLSKFRRLKNSHIFHIKCWCFLEKKNIILGGGPPIRFSDNILYCILMLMGDNSGIFLHFSMLMLTFLFNLNSQNITEVIVTSHLFTGLMLLWPQSCKNILVVC